MSQAYRVVFECPKSGHNINLQKKCAKPSLSEEEAREMFADEKVSCSHPGCEWRGKASQTKLLRILPFKWIFSPAA
jgi:hypothetical protein